MIYVEANIHLQINNLMLTKEDILFMPLFRDVSIYFFDVSKAKHFEDLSHLNLKDNVAVQSSDLMNIPYQIVEHVKPGLFRLVHFYFYKYFIQNIIFDCYC